MLEMVSTVVSLNPPRVSMARGRKEMPAAWHVAPWAANEWLPSFPPTYVAIIMAMVSASSNSCSCERLGVSTVSH